MNANKDTLTLNQVIQDLHAIEERLQEFEEKYQLLSDTFYKLYLAEKVEDSLEFTEWIGLYKMKLEREADYEAAVLAKSLPLPLVALAK
jgi:hypothetical protein